MKPCPFCGSTEVEANIDQYRRTSVRCSACQACGPTGGLLEGELRGETFRAAAAAWDKRAGETGLAAAGSGFAGGTPVGYDCQASPTVCPKHPGQPLVPAVADPRVHYCQSCWDEQVDQPFGHHQRCQCPTCGSWRTGAGAYCADCAQAAKLAGEAPAGDT